MEDAPSIIDHLCPACAQHFDVVQTSLVSLDVPFVVNKRLVRGLDYYSKTVFEWVTDQLGAQGTICAGGRFDGLVEYLGGKPTPAFGFALGLERLLALLEAGNAEIPDCHPHVYLVLNGQQAVQHGIVFAEQLRTALPGLRLQSNCGNGSFKSQFKRADKSGASLALVMGDDEVTQGTVILKPLRSEAGQETVSQQDVAARIAKEF